MSDDKKKKEDTVHAKCRRGNNRATEGQSCNSLSAFNMSIPGSGVMKLKCAKCGFTWTIATGGPHNF